MFFGHSIHILQSCFWLTELTETQLYETTLLFKSKSTTSLSHNNSLSLSLSLAFFFLHSPNTISTLLFLSLLPPFTKSVVVSPTTPFEIKEIVTYRLVNGSWTSTKSLQEATTRIEPSLSGKGEIQIERTKRFGIFGGFRSEEWCLQIQRLHLSLYSRGRQWRS